MTLNQWWTQVFLRSFSHYILLPALLGLILVLAIATPLLNFGAALGVPDLIVHDVLGKRLMVGCSLGFLWMTVLYGGYLLWRKDCRDGRVVLPARVVPFKEYAWKVTLCFVGTVVAMIVLVMAFRYILPEVAQVLPAGPGFFESLPAWKWETLGLWAALLVTVGVLWSLSDWAFRTWLHMRSAKPPAATAKSATVVKQPLWWWIVWLTFAVVLTGFAAFFHDYEYEPVRPDMPLKWERTIAVLGAFVLCILMQWIWSRPKRGPWIVGVNKTLIVVAILLTLGGLYQIDWGWAYVATMIFLGIALLVRRLRPKMRVLTFWLIYLVGAYFSVTWFFARDWAEGWAATMVFVTLAQLEWKSYGAPIKWVLRAMKHSRKKPKPDEQEARNLGWGLTLLGTFFFILICSTDWSSPATFGCFLLFVVAVFYIVLSVYLHRAKLLVFAALMVAVFFSGVATYHFRFPGLNYSNNHLQDLAVCEQEHKRQLEFDHEIVEFLKNHKIIVELFGEETDLHTKIEALNAMRARLTKLGDGEATDEVTNARLIETIDQRQTTRASLDAALQNVKVKKDLDALLNSWKGLEKSNRVLPLRIPPYPVMDLLKRHTGLMFPLADEPDPKDGRPLPLLPIEHAEFSAKPDQLEFRDKADPPVVVVVVSGGGIRAAAWAFVVLKELELHFAEKRIDFPHQVKIITGASGGMLGASYYVELLNHPGVTAFTPPHDPQQKDEWSTLTDERKEKLLQEYEKNWTDLVEGRKGRKKILGDRYKDLTKDMLTPVMGQLVLGDLPNLFSPWPSQYDRGQALEKAWSSHLDKTLDKSFSTFREAEKQGERPFLVFTPMMVEDGRRVLISNLDMRSVVQNGGNLIEPRASISPHTEQIYSREALELFRLFPHAPKDFKLSTAVRMSASFPFFSPAISLPTTPRRRVVDAGYYDSYGVSLAAAWIFSTRNSQAFKRKTSGRYLIVQIRDSSSDKARTMTTMDKKSSASTGRAIQEIISPAEGLYNSRDGSSSFRNDGQLELLTQFIRKSDRFQDPTIFIRKSDRFQDPTIPDFMVVNFELASPAPLSWYLSDKESSALAVNFQLEVANKERLEQVVKWWKRERK